MRGSHRNPTKRVGVEMSDADFEQAVRESRAAAARLRAAGLSAAADDSDDFIDRVVAYVRHEVVPTPEARAQTPSP